MGILIGIFVNNLLPVFLIIGVGVLIGVLVKPNVRSISRTTFYALTPCAIFASLTGAELTGAETGQVALFAAIATLTTAALAWPVATLLGWRGVRRRAALLSVLVINSGNFGVSVCLFAFGAEGKARAMVYFVTTAAIASSLGVVLAAGGGSWRKAFDNLVRIPMLYALVAAIPVMLFPQTLRVPAVLMRPIDLLGDAAVPMMLLTLGLQLAESVRGLHNHIGPILFAAAFRLLVAPLVALPVARLTGVQGVTFQTAMVEASTPTGVTAAILALEYELEPEAVTGAIFFSTLLSGLTLSVLIGIL